MGKTILITGASTGIGLAFARRYAQMGYDLILTARSEERLQALAAELRATHGVRAWVYPEDLSREGAARDLFARITEDGLGVDVLINNAGFGASGLFTDIDEELQRRMIGVNVSALTQLTHLVLGEMLLKGGGTIINLASMAAFMPMGHTAVYAATKAYVFSFTQALVQEYKGRGVRFLAVCPGPTDTPFFDRVSKTRMPMRTAGQVVDTTMRALRQKNKTSVIDGGMSRFAYILLRLAPRRLSNSIGAEIFRRGGDQ